MTIRRKYSMKVDDYEVNRRTLSSLTKSSYSNSRQHPALPFPHCRSHYPVTLYPLYLVVALYAESTMEFKCFELVDEQKVVDVMQVSRIKGLIPQLTGHNLSFFNSMFITCYVI